MKICSLNNLFSWQGRSRQAKGLRHIRAVIPPPNTNVLNDLKVFNVINDFNDYDCRISGTKIYNSRAFV